jgi:predicted TIM-barrel fold metal-dependent hydrolase
MARLPASDGVSQPAFQCLLELCRDPRAWVKVSAADRMVDTADELDRTVPFIRDLAEASPDRVIWGTDWPHPNIRFMPDDGDMIDLLAAAVREEAARDRILVDNPERLYCFEREAVQ